MTEKGLTHSILTLIPSGPTDTCMSRWPQLPSCRLANLSLGSWAESQGQASPVKPKAKVAQFWSFITKSVPHQAVYCVLLSLLLFPMYMSEPLHCCLSHLTSCSWALAFLTPFLPTWRAPPGQQSTICHDLHNYYQFAPNYKHSGIFLQKKVNLFVQNYPSETQIPIWKEEKKIETDAEISHDNKILQ